MYCLSIYLSIYIIYLSISCTLEFDRPNLGCRVLIYRNFSKILPAILRDITDWTVNSRIKSSQLLHTLLYHMEDHVTHHIQAVLGGLYRACQDEEKIVSEEAVKSANLIGIYVCILICICVVNIYILYI